MTIGVLNVNKPLGLTSHDVVARVRRIAEQRRVGHAGTLDPMATGVLVLCLGKATRLIEYIADTDKTYVATVRFGIETETYDTEGDVIEQQEWRHISRDGVEQALDRFRGAIQQLPPMFSALKRDGQPLYKLARRGIKVHIEPRDVRIHQLEIVAWQPPDVVLKVACSKGTYIPSLAHDLGLAAGTVAHLAALERVAVGRFGIDDAVPLETLMSEDRRGEWQRHLVSPADALVDMPHVAIGDEEASTLCYGQSIPLDMPPDAERACTTDREGKLVAIVRPDSAPGMWRPEKVLVDGERYRHSRVMPE